MVYEVSNFKLNFLRFEGPEFLKLKMIKFESKIAVIISF